MNHRIPFLVFGLSLLTACAEQYTPVSFVADGDQIIASGTIDETTLQSFLEVTSENPDAKTLVLQNIDGSVDDDANVVFSRVVRVKGFDTVVPSDGLVASGGTDLFLAGNQRVLGPGACVGVHSWSGSGIVATDLAETDPEHGRYLDYFRDIGVEDDFYWFTIAAAPADGMHWMTAAEADQFDLTTRGAPQLGSAAACDAR